MSETRAVTLETAVDTTGARAGFQEIQREAGTMAAAVARSSQQAETAVTGIGGGAEVASRRSESAQRNLISSIERTTIAAQAGGRSTAAYYEMLGRERGVDPAVLEPYLAQLRAIEEAQQRTQEGMRSTTPAMNEFGVSAGQTSAALRQLPAQVSDIFSSLAGGQNPLMVLIQQGGQIKDSFGGVGAALHAIGGEIKSFLLGVESGADSVNNVTETLENLSQQQSSVAEGATQVASGVGDAADAANSLTEAGENARTALAGVQGASGMVVVGVGLAAAAIGVLAYAHEKGSKEATAYARSLILSGNAAGATVDQLSDAARLVGAVSGSRGQAAAAIVELTATGQVQIENMRRFATVAIGVEKVIGRSVADTAADFAALGKAPLDALNDINDKYHIITAATYAQVKALQDQGRATEAADLAQKAYAEGVDRQRQKVLDTLTDWERGWLRIKSGASGALDSVIDFALGRSKTDLEKINSLLDDRTELEENLRRAQARGLTADVASYQAQLDSNKRAINAIRDRKSASEAAAKAESDAAQATDLRNKWLGESDVLLTRQQKLQRDLAAAETEGLANGLSREEILKRQEVIRRQNYDVAVEGIERQIDAVNRLGALEDIRSQRRLQQITAARSTGTIDDESALRQTGAEELAALTRQKAQLQQQLDLTKKRIESERDQDSINGQIAEVNERRKSREIQLTSDLLALDRQRFQASVQLVNTSFDKATGDRNSLVSQLRDQRDYNDQIGLTAAELLKLSAARLEEQAARKDAEADIAEGLDLNGELADIYRQQAAALRARSAAEREGFVKARDPYVNMRTSLQRYVEESKDSGGMIGDALTGAFRRAEDAFADFATTGKLNFRDFATSIIADFARIQAKAAIGGFASSLLGSMGTSTTSGWGSSLMKALGVSGARAAGGPVNSGLSYLVGEKGPEIFTPSGSGSITPNHMIGTGGSSGAMSINFSTVINGGGSTSQASGDAGNSRAAVEALQASFKQWLAKETVQGGMIWKLQQGRR